MDVFIFAAASFTEGFICATTPSAGIKVLALFVVFPPAFSIISRNSKLSCLALSLDTSGVDWGTIFILVGEVKGIAASLVDVLSGTDGDGGGEGCGGIKLTLEGLGGGVGGIREDTVVVAGMLSGLMSSTCL